MLSHVSEYGKVTPFQSEFENAFQQLLLCITRNFEECIKQTVKIVIDDLRQDVTIDKQDEIESGFISRSEAVQFLKISYPTLHRYQKSGLLPYHKIGRKVYFNKADLINATKVNLKKKGVRHD